LNTIRERSENLFTVEASAETRNPSETVPNSATELQVLVAQIALCPDALVTRILTAATFGNKVANANYWLQENKSLTGNALMQAVDKQSCEVIVKALTRFPTVPCRIARIVFVPRSE
jgi:hypothetical protein